MWVGGSAIMFVLIMFVFLAWSRQGQYADSRGWLETARRASLEQLTAAGAPAAGSAAANGAAESAPRSRPRSDIDEDEDQLAAYNAFLARINQGGHQPPS
jgi:putative copper resistance protein D